ncbi:MAG: DUF1963 domain-containing protein [Saprospiraceae bacterium]|jgi:uncharacterized protein YwqG|nr:DUF1963 domain-containing protein [Saprospiraceae bacterium]
MHLYQITQIKPSPADHLISLDVEALGAIPHQDQLVFFKGNGGDTAVTAIESVKKTGDNKYTLELAILTDYIEIDLMEIMPGKRLLGGPSKDDFYQLNLEQRRQWLVEVAKSYCSKAVGEYIAAALRQGVGLVTAEEGRGNRTGGSRLGGSPDLPAGSRWPHTPGGLPLGLLAQFNIGELRQLPHITALKDFQGEGLLSFFVYPFAEGDSGLLQKPGNYKVMYFPDSSAMKKQPEPEELEEAVWPDPAFCLPFDVLELPSSETATRDNAGWSPSDLRDYGYCYQICREYLTAADYRNKLLGYPDQLPELAGDKPPLAKPGEVLLFQFDCTDPVLDMMPFLGEGVLYFFIKDTHLKDLHFDEVRLEIEGA